VDAGQPLALETAEPIGERYLLGWTRSLADSAESGKDLRGPVHIERLRRVPGRGYRHNFSQAVALRCVYGCAASVLFFGLPGTWHPDLAARFCAASPHKQRVRDRAVPCAERQKAAARGAGNDGYCRALAEKPESLDSSRLSGREQPCPAGQPATACADWLCCVPGLGNQEED